MECSKKILLVIFFFTIFLYSPAVAEMAKQQEQLGVVLVAHGSNNPQLDCNTQVQALYEKIKRDEPSLKLELAFLRYANKKTLKDAVINLQAQGINNILFIHLSPSSFSIRHIELTESIAETIASSKKVMIKKPWSYKQVLASYDLPAMHYAVSPAMDDNPLIVKILSDQAQEILNSPSQEMLRNPESASLLLVSYGAVDELENILWDRQMEQIGEAIKSKIGFRSVVCISLRNHSADLIREQAIIELIKTAKSLKDQGRVIVVPYVLCAGAFQQSLQSYLEGIIPSEDISSKSVISDLDAVVLWVRNVIARGMNQPASPSVNRNWSLMDIEKGDKIGTNKYGVCEN